MAGFVLFGQRNFHFTAVIEQNARSTKQQSKRGPP